MKFETLLTACYCCSVLKTNEHVLKLTDKWHVRDVNKQQMNLFGSYIFKLSRTVRSNRSCFRRFKGKTTLFKYINKYYKYWLQTGYYKLHQTLNSIHHSKYCPTLINTPHRFRELNSHHVQIINIMRNTSEAITYLSTVY